MAKKKVLKTPIPEITDSSPTQLIYVQIQAHASSEEAVMATSEVEKFDYL